MELETIQKLADFGFAALILGVLIWVLANHSKEREKDREERKTMQQSFQKNTEALGGIEKILSAVNENLRNLK